MPTKIVLKNSVVQDKVPTAGDIDIGEVCVNANQASPMLVFKDDAGSIVRITPGGGVSSVNTKTGDVTLNAADVGALAPGDDISQLNNNSNFIDAAGAPVQTVNTQTGDVVLSAADVGALPDSTSLDFVPLGSWTAIPAL